MRKNCKPQCMVYHDKRTKYSKLIFLKKVSLSYLQPKQSSVIAVVTTNHLFIRFTDEEEEQQTWGGKDDDDEAPWEKWKFIGWFALFCYVIIIITIDL